VRKVYKNHTVRVGNRVLNIPRVPGSHRSYAGKTVTVKHLLSGDYRIHLDGHCIGWSEGERPKGTVAGARTELGYAKRRRQQDDARRRQDEQDDTDEG
jgi:hypothetical protein